jgi:PAS domain S-box-containing protein
MIELKKEVNELCDRLGQPPRYPLEFETKRLMPSEATTGEGVRAAPRIHAEVESRFGVLPNFFRLAPESPEITSNLWGFARFAYLDNPLPSLFKERLFVYLSRFCEVRYCIVRHVGFLLGLGRPSGDQQSPVQTIEEVIRLIRRPLRRGEEDLQPYLLQCATCSGPLAELPDPDTAMEEAIFACATHAFMQTPDAPKCLDALKCAFGESRFQHLMVFLAFVRTAHYWTKVHTELVFEKDVKELLATQEVLAECLLNDPEAGTSEISHKLMDELGSRRESKKQHDELLRAHQVARESEERLRQSNAELAQRIAELRNANEELQNSRRAALNLIEDAAQAKEALRQRSAQYETLLNQAPLGVYLVDADFRIRQVNPIALPVFGNIPDLIGRDLDEVLRILWTKEYADEVVRIFRRTLETGEPYETPERIEYRIDRQMMEYYEWRVDRIPLPEGGYGVVCYFRDISAQVRARETIKESEERFRKLAAIVESSADAIISKDLNSVITSWNKGAERLFGYTAQEAIGQPVTMLMPPERIDEEPGILERIRRGERIEHYDTVRRRKDGTLLDVSLTVSPIVDTYGRIVGASKIAREITERKKTDQQLRSLKEDLEMRVAERTQELHHANMKLLREMEERKRLHEQLLQAQKMESLGTLAAGIAHDFNNILNIIQGYAFILQGQGGAENREISESLAVIDETIQRGAALVQQLLTMARKTEVKRGAVDANRLIDGLIAVIKETFPKNIELSSDLACDLPTTIGDVNQIGQALLNLCVNARDAMPNGGRMIFRTQSVDAATLQGLSETIDGRYICIEVSDTGVGMDESIRKRIFEPFFTTKVAGHGTGLGLSVVYGIVKSHDGLIDVKSKPERGTAFRLYFPVAPATAQRVTSSVARKSVSDTKAASNGPATIFLVEDEKNMLYLLEKVFLRQGYQVFTATDGEKALEIFLGHKDLIDVVLLDIGLPKIAGRDVLSEMRQANPNVKICVVSGYLEPELQSEIDRMGVRNFLHKPYTPDEVVTTIQSLIQGKS